MDLRTDPSVIVEITENTTGMMIEQQAEADAAVFNHTARLAVTDRKAR